MDFFEVVRQRHSIRSYRPQEIEEDKLAKVLATINSAPSAGDLQAYEIVLVRQSETKQALARAAFGQDFLAQAPVVLVFCADHMRSAAKYGERGAKLYAVQDATIAAAYCQLAASALELGTVWIGAFAEQAAREAIGAPDQITPVAIVPVGYPGEVPEPTPRRRLDQLVRNDRF